MTIETRDFGSMTIDPEQIIHFVSTIYGFEKNSNFTILYDDSVEGPFSWLQSTDEKDVCFILVDPLLVFSDYKPKLTKETINLLKLTANQDPVYRVLAVIKEDFWKTTVNLKSPIVINTEEKCAAQIILDEDFPVRAPLLVGGEEKSC